MEDLERDLAAFAVHGSGDPAVPTGLDAVGQLGPERQQPPGAIGGVTPGDDECDSAAGTLGEVGRQAAGVAGAIFEAGVNRSHDHAVIQRGCADVQRRQQNRVRTSGLLGLHSFSNTSVHHSVNPSSTRIPPRSTRY